MALHAGAIKAGRLSFFRTRMLSLFELRRALISYQDYRMLLLILAG